MNSEFKLRFIGSKAFAIYHSPCSSRTRYIEQICPKNNYVEFNYWYRWHGPTGETIVLWKIHLKVDA